MECVRTHYAPNLSEREIRWTLCRNFSTILSLHVNENRIPQSGIAMDGFFIVDGLAVWNKRQEYDVRTVLPKNVRRLVSFFGLKKMKVGFNNAREK